MKTIIATILLLAPTLTFAAATSTIPDACAFADIRLKEIQTDWSHKGFFVHAKEQFTTGVRGTFHENLAMRFYDEPSVYRAWQASPRHNQNLQATSTRQCLRSSNGFWVLIKWLSPK